MSVLGFSPLQKPGAAVGINLHLRDQQAPFHDFGIEACAAMTDEELEGQLNNASLIRNRNKIFSVRKNAQAVQKIQKEFGSFDPISTCGHYEAGIAVALRSFEGDTERRIIHNRVIETGNYKHALIPDCVLLPADGGERIFLLYIRFLAFCP